MKAASLLLCILLGGCRLPTAAPVSLESQARIPRHESLPEIQNFRGSWVGDELHVRVSLGLNGAAISPETYRWTLRISPCALEETWDVTVWNYLGWLTSWNGGSSYDLAVVHATPRSIDVRLKMPGRFVECNGEPTRVVLSMSRTEPPYLTRYVIADIGQGPAGEPYSHAEPGKPGRFGDGGGALVP